jgi:tetratricopeptide (TPR) repeat protein
MSSSTAQQYIEVFGDDVQARLALLACSAALRLDDEAAHAAIELVAQSNGSTKDLLRRVKNLGCVWREWDGSWYVAEDVRPYLLDRLHEDVPEATVVRLRARIAANADAHAERLPPDGQVTSHDKLLSKFEAAYQRVFIPEQSEEGAARLAEIWQHSPPAEKRATERAVDYLAYEFDRRLRRLPDEVIFLRGMAARSRGDKEGEEKYFGEVWGRGRHGYIYAVAAHLYGLLIKRRDSKVAEKALRASLGWYTNPFHQAQVYHSLGNLLVKGPRKQEAEGAYRRSLDLDKNDYSRAETLHSLGNLLAKSPARRAEAEAAYRQSVEFYPNDFHQAQVYHSLGNLLAKSPARRAEAEAAYRQSLKLRRDPSHQGQVYHSLGKLLLEIPERWEEGESALEQSLELDDDPIHQTQVLATWAVALSELNVPESDVRAEECAMRALELDPNGTVTRKVLSRVLARVYERRGDYQKALDAYKAWKEADEKLGAWKFARQAEAKIKELTRKMKGRRKSKKKRQQREA